MVVFTCYHCGDSIQKPRVEKHINLECKPSRYAARLTCIDCVKDFDRKTYVDHTKCVSEAERYSGGNYVAKLSSNKGEKKQNSWTEVIQIVLKKPELTDYQRDLLKGLCNYSNVPRKHQKFRNFVASSLRYLRTHQKTVDEVYQLIEAEYKSIQSTNSEDNSVPKKTSAVNSKQPELDDVNKSEDIPSDDKPTQNKESNKDKLKDIENTEIPEESTSATEKVNLNERAAFEVIKKKKKKSKKENLENENVVAETVTSDNAQSIDENSIKSLESNFEEISMKGISKKKAKKLKLQDEVLENSVSEDPQITVADCKNISVDVQSNEISTTLSSQEVKSEEENLTKKKKKEKKKRLKYEAELKAIETQVIKTDEPSSDLEDKTDNQKQKKKKRKQVDTNEIDEVANKKTKSGELEVAKEENVEATAGKFTCKEAVRAVLQKAEGNEISLKKLTKKVVAEYQACYGEEESYEDLFKRFNRKISKLPFVKILKDRVKLSKLE